MQRANQLCCKADALIVGSMSVEEMFVDLQEVFQQLRDWNMTIATSDYYIGPKSSSLICWE